MKFRLGHEKRIVVKATLAIFLGCLAIALAACSGDEETSAVKPTLRATLPTVTVTDDAAATDAMEPIVEGEPETPVTAAPDSEGAATDMTATESTGEGSSPVEPEPPPAATGRAGAVEFPDGVAVLARFTPGPSTGKEYWESDIVRIYRQTDGDLVREALFDARPHQRECGEVHYDALVLARELTECGGNFGFFSLPARPDASSIVMTLCAEGPCVWFGAYHAEDQDDIEQHGSTAIYESRDGGVTWERLAIFDVPWSATRILPDEDGKTRLLLSAMRPFGPFDQKAESRPWSWPDDMLWSNGELRKLPDPPSDLEGYKQECERCLMLPEGRLLLPSRSQMRIGEPETGEQWRVRLSHEVFRPGDYLEPFAIQQGPFLQVVDVGESCLRVRAEPSLKSKELTCMAERVLLTDLGDVITDGGTTWHSVQTPAGVEGWASGRYLER